MSGKELDMQWLELEMCLVGVFEEEQEACLVEAEWVRGEGLGQEVDT